MKMSPLKAVAPILTVLLFVLPVNAAPAQGAVEAAGWERNIDTTKPVLNASVYDGYLSIEVSDKGTGVKVIYVNGYEFTEIEDGKLDIRLSRFDAAYEFFTVSAMDEAGNMSAVYRVRNPYYEDPESEDEEEGLDELLPTEAGPTDPNEARASVTDVNETDEFFTITTDNGKIFYLIIDRTEDEENVYFLTEISENDLLNVTSDTNETLPRNTAVEDSAIPAETMISGQTVVNTNPGSEGTSDSGKEEKEMSDEKPGLQEKVEAIKANPRSGYILMGVIGAIIIGIAYYLKVVKKKQDGDFVEDENDDEDEDEYEDFEPVDKSET